MGSLSGEADYKSASLVWGDELPRRLPWLGEINYRSGFPEHRHRSPSRCLPSTLRTEPDDTSRTLFTPVSCYATYEGAGRGKVRQQGNVHTIGTILTTHPRSRRVRRGLYRRITQRHPHPLEHSQSSPAPRATTTNAKPEPRQQNPPTTTAPARSRRAGHRHAGIPVPSPTLFHGFHLLTSAPPPLPPLPEMRPSGPDLRPLPLVCFGAGFDPDVDCFGLGALSCFGPVELDDPPVFGHAGGFPARLPGVVIGDGGVSKLLGGVCIVLGARAALGNPGGVRIGGTLFAGGGGDPLTVNADNAGLGGVIVTAAAVGVLVTLPPPLLAAAAATSALPAGLFPHPSKSASVPAFFRVTGRGTPSHLLGGGRCADMQPSPRWAK